MTSSRHQLNEHYSAKWDGQQLIAYRHYRNTERPLCYLNISALLKVASDSLCAWLDSKSRRKRNSPASIPDRSTGATGAFPSQCERLLEHYRNGGSITTLEASRLFGITQLSSRNIEINRKLALEGDEHRVVSERIKVPTRSGKQASVCKYYLGKDQ